MMTMGVPGGLMILIHSHERFYFSYLQLLLFVEPLSDALAECPQPLSLTRFNWNWIWS